MGLISITNPNDGESIDAADVATPFNTLKNEFNGNIDNDNIKAAAAIKLTKLGFVGCRVYGSAGQTISNNSSTALTFDSESYDSDSFHSTSSNTSRITIPTGMGGKYSIKGIVDFSANTTGIRRLEIKLNGSTTLALSDAPTTSAGQSDICVTTDYALSAGDYVELYAVQNSGGNLDTVGGVGGSSFSVSFLGA